MLPIGPDSETPHDAPVVLVVDDDAIIRSLLHDVLTEDGFNVVTAAAAAAATLLLATQQVDLLITDIDLGPGDDGYVLARLARMARPGLPIIYISGGRNPADGGRVDGATFIPKPFGLDVLAGAVATALAA